MKLLIVAATDNELDFVEQNIENSLFAQHQIDFLLAGVGMVKTSYHLCKKLCEKSYDLAINIGLAGAFNKHLELADVVEVYSDQFSELGAEDGDLFLSLPEMELAAVNDFPFKDNCIFADSNFTTSLEKVRGITVSTVHGNEKNIEKIRERLHPDVESMEGAAFMYVCKMQDQSCIQIRSISNYVERRNRESWEITKALNNLSLELNKFLKKI